MPPRRAPLANSGRLRFRSNKTAALYRKVRGPLVAEILAETARCQYPACWKRPSEIHERRRRSQGGSITDRANLVALCHEHHMEVTFHARPWMYLHGLLEQRGGGAPTAKIPFKSVCDFCVLYGKTSCEPCRVDEPQADAA